MHKTESFLENDMQGILWDFEIQTDPLIQARRLDQVITEKKRVPAVQWILSSQCTKERQVLRTYLPTLPLGQDMTQGQFLGGV